jgi:predicted ATP-grasp superfamily ATP-dependent carboligase
LESGGGPATNGAMALKILLSEGMSLSAREAITVLGRGGRTVEICAPQRWCLGGYSKWVDKVHVMPMAGSDPAGYVRSVAEVCAREPIDVLLPVHEQAYLFAALRRREPSWPGARTAVPVASFAAFQAVQTKDALTATLAAAGLPQPQTSVVRSAEELLEQGDALLRAAGGCLVKATAGTASAGLHLIENRRQLEELAAATDLPDRLPLVVQERVIGPLERLQAVYADGTLAAIHCFRQLVAGPGGGDVLKESVSRPVVVEQMQALGARLRWHGALDFDYLLRSGDPGQPRYIDANPRLVEPVSALLSGVDLGDALLRVALGEDAGPLVVGRAGVRTRLGIPGLIERAAATGRRRAVLGDLVAQLCSRGRYAGSVEELTPADDGPMSRVPYWGVVLQLLLQPGAGGAISRNTVASFALGPRGHDYVNRLA